MPIRTLRVAIFASVCSLGIGLLSDPAAAQTTTATISGTVLDNQRLAVPGATLTIEERDRGTTRTVPADERGAFEIAGLAPGDYVLRATLTGFATTELAVRLEVNQRLRVDVVVQPAGVAENVVVRQSVDLLDRTDASVGQVIDEHQLSNLPLNGRQFLELSLLVPGVHTSHGAGTWRDAAALLASRSELGHQRHRWQTKRERLQDRRDRQYRSLVQHVHRQPPARCHPRVPD